MSKVKVYSTIACPYCYAAMDWLDSLGVEYEELDAEDNPEIEAAPTIFVGEEKIEGFDRPAIKKALEKAKLI